MTAFLLDTDVMIDFLHGRAEAVSFLQQSRSVGDDLALTVVTIGEIFTGVAPADRETVAAVLAGFPILDLTATIARRAGEYRYDFARQGQILSLADTLIAAAAREHQAVLVTRNQRHYPMTDIQVQVL